MSLESATAFVERIRTDSAFRESVLAKPKGPERGEVMEAAGYAFSPQELAQARAELAGGSLSESDLANVAGGASGRDCGPHYCR